jgi:hypothetical protein
MEVNQHLVLDRPYQGDGIRIVFVVFSLYMIARLTLAARRKRKASEPVNARAVTAGCLVFLAVPQSEYFNYGRTTNTAMCQ